MWCPEHLTTPQKKDAYEVHRDRRAPQGYVSQPEGKLPVGRAETMSINKVNILDCNPECKIPTCLNRGINDHITQLEKNSSYKVSRS